jgi:peroxiredoxin
VDIAEKALSPVRSDNLYALPKDLPVPSDDGACDHLRGRMLPSIALEATSGAKIDLSKEGRPWLVVYCYPRTGRPDQEPLGGAAEWNAIPGARGCTPQSCAYRDHHAELAALGATVYGFSTQDTGYQSEAVERLHLPFPLLSDARLEFARAMRLPTFSFAGLELIKRLTLIARAGRIEEVLYPVFPSDADAGRVMEWLGSHGRGHAGARR